MKTLEACYEINFSKINYLERKVRITHPKTIINGPAKVGKSYLIFDYLANFKNEEYIYIDFLDIRNDKAEIELELDNFLRAKKIKVLVLENFDFSFELPYCDNIIITSNLYKKLRGYKNIFLKALDFEEYLLHDTRHQNTTVSFNNFLKYGNLSETVNIEENKKIQRLQEILNLQTKDETEFEILKILIENIDEKKSIFQLFNQLKAKIKISKDRFYDSCSKLQENNTIYFLQKYNQEKATKKIFLYNHSFLNVVSHNKKLKNEFSNIIFLELIGKYPEVFYLDSIDFFIPKENSGIVAIPFFSSFLMKNQLKKIYKSLKDNNIEKLLIITISNDEKFKYNDMQIEVMPFYEWAVT